jgi:hypothetical protein
VSKYGSRTDALWAPLREALPSFAERWRAYTAQPGYDPLHVDMNVIELSSHVEDLVRTNPDALGPLFAEMERLYAADPELRDLLTINVLEAVTGAADEEGVDFRRLARLLPGPETRAAWHEALTWTHPECHWDDVRGLVPDRPPPVPVGRIRLTAFPPATPDLPAFPVDCELLDGAVRPGHFLWQRLSSCHHAGREIVAVERLTSPGRLRLMLAYYESEGPGERLFIAEGWYEPGEVVEIIEALPSKDEVHDRDAPSGSEDKSASRPAI